MFLVLRADSARHQLRTIRRSVCDAGRFTCGKTWGEACLLPTLIDALIIVGSMKNLDGRAQCMGA